MTTWLRVITAGLVLSACGVDAVPSASDEIQPELDANALPTTPLQLVDSTIPAAVAGEEGWNYHRSADVDLTGDGALERVVLTARVELYRGQPAWDDGQPWQVYVETGDGSRTYIYAQRLQLGMLTMRVSRGNGDLPTIVLMEHLPDKLRLLEASYIGASSSPSVAVRFERDLDPRGDLASPSLP